MKRKNSVNKESSILARIKQIVEKKELVINDMTKLSSYKENLQEGRLAWLHDPGSTEYRDIRKERDEIILLLKLERSLEKELVELRNEEIGFFKALEDWKEIEQILAQENLSHLVEEYRGVIQNIRDISQSIKKLIAMYIHIEVQEIEETEELERLIEPKTLDENISNKWKKLKDKADLELMNHFEIEKGIFEKLSVFVVRQKKLVFGIYELLDYLEKLEKAKTKIIFIGSKPKTSKLIKGIVEGTGITVKVSVTGILPLIVIASLKRVGTDERKIVKELNLYRRERRTAFIVPTQTQTERFIGDYDLILSAESEKFHNKDEVTIKVRINPGKIGPTELEEESSEAQVEELRQAVQNLRELLENRPKIPGE